MAYRTFPSAKNALFCLLFYIIFFSREKNVWKIQVKIRTYSKCYHETRWKGLQLYLFIKIFCLWFSFLTLSVTYLMLRNMFQALKIWNMTRQDGDQDVTRMNDISCCCSNGCLAFPSFLNSNYSETIWPSHKGYWL